METGTVDATIDYFSGSGTSSIQFRYIVSALENTADLNYASTSALSLNGGTIRDVGGNDLNLTLPDPASANSLAGNKDIVIDTQAPAAALSYSDSLVRFEDGTVTITATFTDSMSLDSLPKITVTFPGSGSPDVDAAPMVFDAGDTWHYVLSLIDNVNGTIQVSVTGKDKALNDLPGSSVSGGNVLRIDTTDPVLSAVSPDTGSYINHKRIGWTLSESLVSGSVTFTRLSGGGSTVTAALAGTELDAGIRPPAELTHTADLALVDGTVYRLTISGVDSAGNTGTVNLDDITYDTTPPTASLSYDQYYASSDTTVLITATFSEPMLPVPLISVDFAGVGQDITDQAMTIGTDSTEWTYALAIPTGTANNGIASVSLSATDLAANPLSNGDVTGRDTLMVDNSAPSVSFSYANLSQPRLSASGKGGDQIRVTATFSEVTKNAPAPLLSVNYGDTTVTGIVNSGTQGDSVWTFDFTLLSTVTAERYLTVSVTAEDLAGNAITTATNDQAFFLDNLAPADFATGDVTTTGYNPVPGWINGRTDSIYVVVPLASSDNTLLFGGQVEIQMSIPARMGSGNWAIIGSNDSITQVGNRSFGRAYSEVVTAFANLGSPITFAQGDTIYTRAVVYDQVGNNTGGQISARSLIYDVAAPTIGSITGGNIFSSDTLVSTDSITVQWSEFIDPSPSTASGTAYYEVGVEHVGDTPLLTCMDWDSVGLATIGRYRLPLQHNEHYRVHIRAFDQAGNISDTLVSNSILRLNSPPVLAAIDSQQVDEDVKFQYRVRATDIDSTTLLGESLHFTVLDTGIVHPNHNITIDDVTGVVVWNTPLQQDTGRYTIRIGVRDNWGFADTTDLILTVNSVNDTPVVVIPPPANQVIFIEDHTDLVQLNLTPYATDVDNDSTQITWQAVILDTTTKNGYPLGRVISGPGTDPRQDQLLSRQYSGWTDPGKGGVSPQSLGEITLPFAQKITVTIDTIQGSTIATFDADTNYYGANHRILFYASDPQGATAMDTVFLTVLPDNDPPVIAAIPDTTVLENDSLRLDFADWVTDVDDTLLTFSVTALTNGSHMTLTPSTFTSTGFGDSVLLKPQSLWSDSALIQLIVTDSYATADTALFVLDIIRVPRPALGIAVIQNNAFTNYYDIVVTDTLEKVVSLSLTVQNEPVSLDTAGFFTYVGRYQFVTAGTYTFQVYAQGVVGDTLVSRDVGLALARVLQPWSGFSSDGRLKISGDPGVVAFDQSVMIFDSTMMDPHKARKACYRVGHPGNLLDGPAQVALQSDDEHQAVYWSADGVAWEELPSISEEGTVKAWTEKWGYYKLGERTIIVPGMTSIANSYPNPFNPVTTLEYNIGFADGPNQVVEISVYNLLGQHIRTLLKGYQPIGRHTIQWNGRDQQGQTVASGVYFIQLQTNKGRIKSRKVMLLR
ncbi:MAG: T9SS C-terminal target domain-containing protein [Candidatus Neomarinimicrobiota bacterium]|nr:MAG: T9SS C-terminal target domain-containing protein [Candidatus Neomarinimicrobiota bacterium]